MTSIIADTAKSELLSIVIPAYNKPDYLRKCLSSILAQNYRPIQIVVSDDQSPDSLEPLIIEMRDKCDSLINIIYIKPSENLRPYWNLYFGLSRANGKYAIIMPHDDWVIDVNFFDESIAQMTTHNCCYVSVGNSVVEGTEICMMNDNIKEWTYLNGREYVSQRLYKDLHPSYSAVVFNLKKLHQLNYTAYFIKKEDGNRLAIEPDEGFLMINLLATSGEVAITGKVVSVRGNPPDSYSKTDFWQKHCNSGLFIVHMQLYRYYLERGYNECAVLMKKRLMISAVKKYNHKIINYLGGNRSAQWFMVISILKQMLRRSLRILLPASLVRILKANF